MEKMRAFRSLLLGILLCASLLAACQASPPDVPLAEGQFGAPTRTPFQPLPAQAEETAAPQPGQAAAPQPEEATTTAPLPTAAPPTATPSATPPPAPVAVDNRLGLWVDPRLPQALRSAVALPAGYRLTEAPEGAALRLEFGGQAPASRWVYALVAPFPTKVQGVALEDLRRAWRGEASGTLGGRPLLMEESTRLALESLWGPAAEGAIKILAANEILSYAWEHQPAAAVVPFEAMDSRWKVLEIDGASPLRKEFDLATYPLAVPVSLNGGAPAVSIVPASNRDPGKLTTVVMTGVTALVRATAFTMERRGVNYPGKDVRDWLRGADLTHISNEVPFAENCPFPDPVQEGMRFCSDGRYIGLLEDVGTDIVELTGDHFQDWGENAMLYTLQLYGERGWKYYGGGENLEAGRRALTLEHNGNKLAFIGCNRKGGGYAQASAKHPGAAECDMGWMADEIARLRKEGYLVIATFQHFEYYNYRAQPDQVRDSRRLAEAGAVVVSGSQAHQPQGMEFVGGSFIHYGLGNLFFDQYDVSPACRQGFIDRHVFYSGRYIGTELLPILFLDYARPRPMTPEERNELLDAVFSASGW